MNFPAPVPREPVHTRRIECRAFRRADGCLDVEGHIEDLRAFPWHSHWVEGGTVPPETPVHGMWLRLTLDAQKTIVDAEAFMEHVPFPHCRGATEHYRRLIGLRIEPGFTRAMNERIGGVEGCTHTSSLIPIMATTALQAMATELQKSVPGHDPDKAWREGSPKVFSDSPTPDYPLLDTCYSHAATSPVVKLLAPHRHSPAAEE